MASRTAVQEVETLEYTPQVARQAAPFLERLRGSVPEVEWPVHAPHLVRIQELKEERRAVILAHNYQTPEIFHGIADIRGDSLGLAREAARTDAEVIVLCGVHFMAETAKIINPRKTVLIPDLRAGCSLAESITGADVRTLRARHPGGLPEPALRVLPNRAGPTVSRFSRAVRRDNRAEEYGNIAHWRG